MASVAYASPLTIEGSYLCNECNGLLEVKKSKNNGYSVKLVVGQGSCGGEVIAKGQSRLLNGKELNVSYKNNKRNCTTKIEFVNGGASISDSCVTAKDEAGSTCAVLGEYSKN